MADRDEQEREQRPIHISMADVVLEQEESGSGGNRTIHAEDGSEQPRLDDMAHHPHGRSSGQSARSTRPIDAGQFTGEGQPSRQQK